MEKEDKIKKAIEIIKFSRYTHLEWEKFFEMYPGEEKRYEKTVHPKIEQRKIIEDYTFVIDLLESL